jgi:hypothetical protein
MSSLTQVSLVMSSSKRSGTSWKPIPQRCVSLDVPCRDLTVTDVTRLTGVICRENGYSSAMFGYLHEMMRRYLADNLSELDGCIGKDILVYFQSNAPRIYRELKRGGMLTVDKAVEYRERSRSGKTTSF